MLTAMRIRNYGAPGMRVYACGPYWHLTKQPNGESEVIVDSSVTKALVIE